MLTSVGLASNTSNEYQTSKQSAGGTRSSDSSSSGSTINSSTETDTISTLASNPVVQKAVWTPTGQPGVYISSDGFQVIKLDEALTPADQNLIKSLNGGSLDGGSQSVEDLKGDIALSRVYGMLQGPVTSNYINSLMQEETQTSELNAQNATSAKAQGNEVASQAYAAYETPDVSMNVLQNALDILNRGVVG